MRTIWLASYPKSGNTWFRLLVANLAARDGKPADINALQSGMAAVRRHFDRVSLIDSGLLTHDEVDRLRPRIYEQMAHEAEPHRETPPVRFAKVHDAYTLTSHQEPLLAGAHGADGAIVVVRDPRDIAPSLAHHLGMPIDDAIAFMNASDSALCRHTDRLHRQLRQKLSDWSGHIASWLDQRDLPVHLLRYEDLSADTASALRQALAFAGCPASEEALRRSARLSTFARLRRQEVEQGFREAASGVRFFRRGQVGAWHDELSAAQVARIEAAHAPMMQRLAYSLATVLEAADS
ncbi:MAG TPA: sulfotransferase domain-containing protein [Stellaceae bacterium]|nr:sulfotransferase domain-containing protein [Stellaceae bacterium]